MMEDDVRHELKSREADLARLADGSLPAAREVALRAEIARSPDLQAALAQQERAVSLVRALHEPAPEQLRERIGALIADRTPAAHGERSASSSSSAARRRRAPALLAAGALGLAVVAALVALVSGGAASSPTLPQTVHLTLASATSGAPARDPAHPEWLRLSVDGVAFPDWSDAAGWTATGARTDTVAGRRIVTVFYTGPGGDRIGYAIVSGAPLPIVPGPTVVRYGVRFTLRRLGQARLVTWRRLGHTCVIAGRTVGYPALLGLAAADASAAAT